MRALYWHGKGDLRVNTVPGGLFSQQLTPFSESSTCAS